MRSAPSRSCSTCSTRRPYDGQCSRAGPTLEHDGPAVYHVVDDEPTATCEWLPALAATLGAEPPRRFPVWLARLFAGAPAVMMGTTTCGASNAKAKRELRWTLRYPSWRTGFAAAYAGAAAPDVPHLVPDGTQVTT